MLCTVPCAPEPRLLALAPVSSWRTRHREPLGLFQSGVIKDRRKRCATAVGERVATVLAIVHNESTDGHRLHCLCEDSDRRVVDTGCNAEQDYAVLCSELCGRLCHGYSRRQLLANEIGRASCRERVY